MLQAAIAACHARARTAEETDWQQIAALYGGLAALTSSPVVELNRAVAVAMADGPSAGLRIVDGLTGEPALAGSTTCPACAATCWPGLAATPRRPANSAVPLSHADAPERAALESAPPTATRVPDRRGRASSSGALVSRRGR